MNAKPITLHMGDGFLMKPVLKVRDIPIDEIFTKYSKGSKKWYTREHLSRIVNGRRPIPVELAKDIAETYDFSWTEFYQVDESRVKLVDAIPCKTHDMRIVFKPTGTKVYCPTEFIKSHYAVAPGEDNSQFFFANYIPSVHLFSKQSIDPTLSNLKDSMMFPIMLKTKNKDFFCGMLCGLSVPIGKTEPLLYIGDIQNTRYVTIEHKDVTNLYHMDFIIIKPKYIV